MSGNEVSIEAQLERERQRSAELVELLERSRAELGEFAVLASHDLRAPLRAISNLCGWIEEDLEAGDIDEVKQHLVKVRTRTRRMDLLLVGLLEFSRVGRKDGDIEPQDVVTMINEIREELKLPKSFRVNQPTDSILIEAPQLALRRVLTHLISNAHIHHDKDEGQLDIEITDEGDWLLFKVWDDGPGIPAKHQKKAFKPLTTLKRRDELEASGMGLAVIKKATEFYAQGVTMVSDGRGCHFTFRWPRRWAPPA